MCEIFSEQAQDIIKPINETISVNCWHLWTKNGRKERKLSDQRLNSPQFNLLVGAFFNPLNWEKNICKSRARHIRSMSLRIRVFYLKNGFEPPRVTSQFVLNSQATCFAKCWWLPLQSHNHMSQSLSWAQRHEPSASLASRLFLGRWLSEIDTNSFWGKKESM